MITLRDESGWTNLIQVVTNHPSLNRLCLNANDLRLEHCKDISRILRVKKKMERIALAANAMIGNFGAKVCESKYF